MKDQSKWVCNSCNARNSITHSFCIKCGTQRPKGMQCPKCGAALVPQQKFCFNCGTLIQHDTIIDSQINTSYIKEDYKHGRFLEANRKQQNTDQPNSHCTKCGKPINGDMDICEQCLGKISKIWTRSIAAILVVALLSGIAVHFVGNKSVDLTDEQIKISYQNYVNISKEINDYEANFTDTNGYVDVDRVDALLKEMAVFAKQLYKKGKITDYSYRDGDSCVYMEIDGWLGILYDPPIEGYLSSGQEIEIITLEPFASEIATFIPYVASGSEGPDEGAELIAKYMNGFSFSHNLDDEEVTMETIKNLPNHSIILLTSHGKFMSEFGSVFSVGKTKGQMLSYELSMAINDGAVHLTPKGHVCITPKFFDLYLQDGHLDGSVVYINSCSSMTDTRLAESIINKGALAVIGNTDEVRMTYAFNALYQFVEGLTPVATGSYCKSVYEAYEYAAKIFSVDRWKGSQLSMCYEYDFSLPEMIALKDGTYDIKENGVIRVIDTDGNPCKNYTMYIAKASKLNGRYLENGADVTPEEVILYADETRTVNSKLPQKLNLDPGIYEIAFRQDDNLDDMVVHTFQVFEDKGNRSISVQIGFGKEAPTEDPTAVPTETSPKNDALSGKCGDDLTWTLKDGVLTISGNGSMPSYDLPSVIPWFDYVHVITKIVVEDGVTNISNSAFSYHDNVRSVSIGNSVSSIGDGAFYDCNKLTNVTIPNGVKYIGYNVFYGCDNLTAISIPVTVTNIESGSFCECSNLSDVYYAGSKADWNAIRIADYNEDLLNATIHYAVEDDINAITGICGDNLRWTLNDGVLTIFGSGPMYNYISTDNATPWYDYNDSIKTIVINDGVTSIGNFAFSHIFNVTQVSIPSSVTRIGSHAFTMCEKLMSIVIPDSVTSLGAFAFEHCRNLTTVVLPNNISRIELYTFYGCKSLSEIEIPSKVTVIDQFAFYSCTSLTDIVIPSKVTTIGLSAFEGSGLISVTLPKSLITVSDYAFNSCNDLKTVNYAGNDQDWKKIHIGPFNSPLLDAYEASKSATDHTPQSGNELSAYIPYVQKAMKVSGYDVSEEYTHGFCSGILIDLDGDNVQELVLHYLEAPLQQDAWWWEEKLSVYDYENNKVVTRLNGVSFGEFGAAGESGYVSILYKSGKPYIMTYNESGETSGSGTIDPNRYGTMTIYDGITCKKVSDYWIDRYNNVVSYKINDKTVDKNRFISEVQQYYDAKVILDYYSLIEFPQMSVSASELLKKMK